MRMRLMVGVGIVVLIAIGVVVYLQRGGVPARVDAIDDPQVLAWIDAAAGDAEAIEEPTDHELAVRTLISLWEAAGYYDRAEALWPGLDEWAQHARSSRGYSLMYRGMVDEGFAQLRKHAAPEEMEGAADLRAAGVDSA
jgi:hypothetical protein